MQENVPATEEPLNEERCRKIHVLIALTKMTIPDLNPNEWVNALFCNLVHCFKNSNYTYGEFRDEMNEFCEQCKDVF